MDPGLDAVGEVSFEVVYYVVPGQQSFAGLARTGC